VQLLSQQVPLREQAHGTAAVVVQQRELAGDVACLSGWVLVWQSSCWRSMFVHVHAHVHVGAGPTAMCVWSAWQHTCVSLVRGGQAMDSWWCFWQCFVHSAECLVAAQATPAAGVCEQSECQLLSQESVEAVG
jgi:hypothetical protein